MFSFICDACASMKNQECKTRRKKKNINNNEPSFCPYSIKVNKSSGSCNNIFNVKVFNLISIDVKVFNLMSINSEKRHVEWHGTWKCKYRIQIRCQCLQL